MFLKPSLSRHRNQSLVRYSQFSIQFGMHVVGLNHLIMTKMGIGMRGFENALRWWLTPNHTR